jgi:hypothetical protein
MSRFTLYNYGGFMKFCTGFIFLSLLSTIGLAQWSSDPTVNNVVCTSANKQELPALCSDGDNGAIIAWWDYRTDVGDIYAQRIDKNGNVLWNTNGVAICTTRYQQSTPKLIPDGKGGAIIVWDDQRTGLYSGNIYAQRVNPNGQVLWTTNGIAVKAGSAYTPYMATDGAGGAIIAWRDDRVSMDAADVYAQRIDSSGNIMWTSTGVAIATAASMQYPSCIVSDDSAGAIIVWTHVRADATTNIFAQRITAAGTKMWNAAGVTIANLTTSSQTPSMQPDKQGGVFIIWTDSRSSTGNRVVYGQHLNSSGVIRWTANGVRLSSETQDLYGFHNFIVDGSNNLIYGFYISVSYYDQSLYAQRISNNGTVMWDTLGLPICTLKWGRYSPEIINDATGGAIMTWYDDRTSETASYPSYLYDIYAQRVDTSGNILWSANGVPVSTANSSQVTPKIIPIDGGGAIITWADYRGGYNYDIYAQRLNASGTITGVATSASFPDKFVLCQNYPNPFNPATTVSFVVGNPSFVTLKIYDVLGREVATLVNRYKNAGRYEVDFDGSKLPSGVYFYRLETKGGVDPGASFIQVKKMLLLK